MVVSEEKAGQTLLIIATGYIMQATLIGGYLIKILYPRYLTKWQCLVVIMVTIIGQAQHTIVALRGMWIWEGGPIRDTILRPNGYGCGRYATNDKNIRDYCTNLH